MMKLVTIIPILRPDRRLQMSTSSDEEVLVLYLYLRQRRRRKRRSMWLHPYIEKNINCRMFVAAKELQQTDRKFMDCYRMSKKSNRKDAKSDTSFLHAGFKATDLQRVSNRFQTSCVVCCLSKFQEPYKVAAKETNKEQGRYKLWEVICAREGQRIFLRSLDAKGAINICKEREESMDIMVEGTRTIQIEKLLRERDIPFIISPVDTVASTLLPRTRCTKSRLSPFNFSFHKSPKVQNIIDWNNFYPLHKINEWMDELEKIYPATCTVTSIGQTVEGRNIKMLKISNSDASNTGVWLDGGIHAREWISTSVVTYIADVIARDFNKHPEYITNKDWYFVPVVNPDGYHYSHVTDRLWRKSRARFGNTIVGVDLNRNFGFNWGKNAIEGTTTGDPNHQNYRGQEPFSEPETCAIKDLLLYSGTPFKIFVTFHAYSEVIAFPWCFTADACPDYVNLLEGGAAMAKAVFDTTGRMYKVGNFKDIMYYAAGTSIDWSYGVAHIPFSYLMELRSKEHRFLLPKEEIIDCCRESMSAIMALAEFVEKKTCRNCTVIATKNQFR